MRSFGWRSLGIALCVLLGSALFLLAGRAEASPAPADAGLPAVVAAAEAVSAPARAGTEEEALTYADREAASPEVQEFVGGTVVVVVGFGFFVVCFLVILVFACGACHD